MKVYLNVLLKSRLLLVVKQLKSVHTTDALVYI